MWSLLKSLADLIAALKANTVAVTANMRATAAQNMLTLEANELAAKNEWLLQKSNALLQALLDRLRSLPDPGPISLLVTSENGNMLTFTITLPPLPPEPNDIVSGELTVTIGSGQPQTIATTKDQTEVVGLSGNQGDRVQASLAYLDDADPPNKSLHPSTLDVVLADTIPPADPGTIGLTVTGEQ